jgi:hypothetical protein
VQVEDMRGPSDSLRIVPTLEASLAPMTSTIFLITCEPSGCPLDSTHIEFSGIARLGGFRVVSDVPVLVYQWNPYGDTPPGDASLVLPRHTLDNDYIVASWHIEALSGDPDFEARSQVTIIATEDNTSLTFTPTVRSWAGPEVPAVNGGATSPVITLNAFDVLQIAAEVEHTDLTGTQITADKPIAVYGGHDCPNIPEYGEGYCDHLEEQLFPLSAWGEDAVLARYAPRVQNTMEEDQPLWRVIAGTDDMTVNFDPPVSGVGGSYYFANSGEMLQFFSPEDHYAWAHLGSTPGNPAPFLAYQLMTGSRYVNGTTGDPAMLLAPPAGQYLERYVFNTEDDWGYAYDHVIIVRQSGTPVTVECLGPLPGGDFTPVGSTSWEVGRFYLDEDGYVGACTDGVQRLTAGGSVGLSVVGANTNTSYAYMGGVGVYHINPIID